MSKIGRNQPCPCGSGKKHKHCCLIQKQAGRAANLNPMRQMKVTLLGEIERIQQTAAFAKPKLFEMGVFIFFSMENGDAWMLDTSDRDAVKVAEQKKALEPPVDESPETIEIEWSHTFALQDRKLMLTDYKDGTVSELVGAPTSQINAAMRRILKQYSPELLKQVHLDSEATADAA